MIRFVAFFILMALCVRANAGTFADNMNSVNKSLGSVNGSSTDSSTGSNKGSAAGKSDSSDHGSSH